MTFLLYGANGYTGQLIAELCAEQILVTPILAGRSREKVQPIADRLGYACRIFDLDDIGAVNKAVAEVDAVLHCAGPFEHTAEPMIAACMRTRTHYLDITGEISVFEYAHSLHKDAEARNMMLLPGCGFDVVPTDCTARYLHEQLPDATHLRLAIGSMGGGVSHGTAATMVENLGRGGKVRREGFLVDKPLGHLTRTIDFGEVQRFAMTIPWGDVSTAFYTTGIPNIEVYSAIKPSAYKWVGMQNALAPLMRTALVKGIARRIVDSRITGPDDDSRSTGKSLVWGEVENADGVKVAATYTGPEGYTLTARSALALVTRVLQGDWQAGFQTPAGCYGADLVLEIVGGERRDL